MLRHARMAAMTGRTAASLGGDERRLRACRYNIGSHVISLSRHLGQLPAFNKEFESPVRVFDPLLQAH
jgi:hypothetical protein